MNEVWAIHQNGELLSKLSGDRSGAVYTTEGAAKRRMTYLKNRSNKYFDWSGLSVVRYVPEEVKQ